MSQYYYQSSPGRYSSYNSGAPSPKSSSFPSPTTTISSSSSGSPSSPSLRSDLTPSMFKRKQVKNACVNCQRACKKCDDQRPCSRCVKYGIEDGCVNSQRKERKKKSQGKSENSAATSNSGTSLRLRLNLKDDQLQQQQQQMYSHFQLQQQLSTNLRSSTRNGIRAFPKELLETLKGKNDEDSTSYDEQDEDEEDDVNEQEERDQQAESEKSEQEFIICPRVTEEFKTLAKLCSDLHTVINNPISPVVSNNNNNNNYHNHNHQHQHQHQQSSFYQPIYPSYRAPLSPVYRVPLIRPTSQQLSHQQFYYQSTPHPVLPINPFLQQANNNNIALRPSSRDFLNRTPPEDSSDNQK